MSKTKFDEQIADVKREGENGKHSSTEAEINERTAKDDKQLRQDKKQVVHGVWVKLVRIMGCGAIILFCVVLWHLLAPQSWRWLSPAETEHLATGFFASLIGYMARSIQRFV